MIRRAQTTLPSCDAMKNLPPEALERVAAYFQALSEPTRLHILNALREGERNVGELAEIVGSSTANVSRHLTLLTGHGLVAREARGNAVYYRIADDSVYALCDIVCGSIGRQLSETQKTRDLFLRSSPRVARARKSQGSTR